MGLVASKPPTVKHSSARTHAFNIRGLVEMAAPSQAQQAEVRARGRQIGGPPSSRRERINRVLGANTPRAAPLVPHSSGAWVVLECYPKQPPPRLLTKSSLTQPQGPGHLMRKKYEDIEKMKVWGELEKRKQGWQMAQQAKISTQDKQIKCDFKKKERRQKCLRKILGTRRGECCGDLALSSSQGHPSWDVRSDAPQPGSLPNMELPQNWAA